MSFPQPPRFETCFLVGASILATALVGGGCAGTRQALEKQVKELESQLLTLKSEKVNLAARNAALDDRVLLLETRRDGCREDERRQRQLQVVRLTAEDEAEDETFEEGPPIPVSPQPAGDGKRPVLSLTGSAQGSVNNAPRGSGSSGAFTGLPLGPLAGDNLGVVSIGGGRGEPAADDGPMALFQDGYRAHANGDHGAALDLLARFLKDHPEHPFADDALFWRGESYLALGKPLKGVGEFERLLGRYPGSDKAASTLYRIGFAYDQLGDPGKASEYYFKVVERHPGTDAARKASRRVAAIRESGRAGGMLPTSAMR
ncbi:MAG TPA: tetratricopeptide repeat protein [Polyangia bacterium]|nr:tetratricopeptide repeat protein [Polyangia bacterium]